MENSTDFREQISLTLPLLRSLADETSFLPYDFSHVTLPMNALITLLSCFLSYDKAFILEGLKAALSCRVAKYPSRAFYDAACSAELGWASAFVDEGLPLAESLIDSGHAYDGKALLERLHNSNTTLHAIKIDSMLLQIYRSTKSPTDALVEKFYIKIRTHSDKCQETNCEHRDQARFAEYKKTAKTILQEQNSYRNAVLRYAFAHPNRASPRDPWADL